MTQATKWKILGVLLLCWAALLVSRLTEEREPQRVPLTYTSGQTAEADRPGTAATVLSLLTVERASATARRAPQKNIFAPLQFPKPKPKKKKKVEVAKPVAPPPPKKPAAPPPPSPEELAAAQARKQMAQYRALGFAEDDGHPTAFLGKGNKIYIAGVGEELEDRIIVAAITDKAVKLRETRTRLETSLPMKGAGKRP